MNPTTRTRHLLRFAATLAFALCVTLAPSPARGTDASDRVPPDRVLPDRVLPDRVLPDRVLPDRVLITNDNGIDDPKIVALARAFAAHTETWVVAPATDQSGTSNFVALGRGAVEVRERDLGPGIRAYAVDGFPADCVVVALAGWLRDRPPGLVVSGINGGPNMGADWMFSGTVGAARVAAYAGFPAIAVSGLDDDLPGAVESAVDWVVRLAGHDIVRDLTPGEYLTISLPRLGPDEVLGAEIAVRAPVRRIPRLAFDEPTSSWRIVGQEVRGVDPVGPVDEALVAQGKIAVVPMHVDEVDARRVQRWFRDRPALPPWRLAGIAPAPVDDDDSRP